MTVVIATHTPQAATGHPSHISNLGSLPVMMDVLTQFVKSEDNPSFILGWGSMGHIGEAKLRDLPTKDSNTTLAEKMQAISYMWSCSRDQVNCGEFLAFYACRDGLQFIWYGISRVINSQVTSGMIYKDCFHLSMHCTGGKICLKTQIHLCHDQKNCLVPSMLPWHSKDYRLVTFSLGDGWRRK